MGITKFVRTSHLVSGSLASQFKKAASVVASHRTGLARRAVQLSKAGTTEAWHFRLSLAAAARRTPLACPGRSDQNPRSGTDRSTQWRVLYHWRCTAVNCSSWRKGRNREVWLRSVVGVNISLKGAGQLSQLLSVLFRLRFGVGAVEKESYNLLEHFPADIHGAVDAIARLYPIHFADGDRPLLKVHSAHPWRNVSIRPTFLINLHQSFGTRLCSSLQ